MGSSSKKAHESFSVAPAGLNEAPQSPLLAAATSLAGNPSSFASLEDTSVVASGHIAAETEKLLGQEQGAVDPDALQLTPDQQLSSLANGDLVTPVPEELPVGDATGTPVLAGGADLYDSLVTLVAYRSGTTSREVLYATVDEAAEAKLLEALAVGDKLVPVQVTEEVIGRLPVDKDNQLHEQIATVAKSVNHHLKDGSPIPKHTLDKVELLTAKLERLGTECEAPVDKAMLSHYADALAVVKERLEPDYGTSYDKGGKVPFVAPYETTGKVTVTKYMAAPADPGSGLLPTQVRDATRVKPTLASDGTTSWNGSSRSGAKGKEYLVDLGDGFEAVYRPYGVNDAASTEFSLRGALEITGPKGPGRAAELVDRLGQLNLVNLPMSHAEAEWTYLQRNVWAQQLEHHPSVAAAAQQAHGLEDAVEHVLFAETAHKAVGMSEPELHSFAKGLRLEAEAKALLEKVRVLREGVAAAVGLADGATLYASSGYQPVPRRRAGWWVWDRFDVAVKKPEVTEAFKSRGLTHNVSGGNVADLFRSGVLASTERRHLMGVGGGKGMSESSDKLSGGANSVFLRVKGKPFKGPALFWDKPTRLLSRADWYAYDGDHFGSVNPKSHFSVKGQVRDPLALAKFSSSSNEVMFRHGIDLLGAEAPSLVKCTSAKQRQDVLDVLSEKGVTELGGRPVEEVVQC